MTESRRAVARSFGRRAGAAAGLALVGAALSCAALIGIDDRLPDEATLSPDAAADGSSSAEASADASADAGADALPTYGVGDGHSGARVISANNTVVNSYAALSSPVAATGKLSLRAVRGDPFAIGDLIIVWQTATTSLPPTNGPVIDLAAANVGHWDVARVTGLVSVDGGGAGLTADLTLDHAVGVAHAYTSPGAQVVRVPEYTDLTVQATGGIGAMQWDGTSGGVIAFYVRGTLQNAGAVSADNAGFRGGVSYITNNGGLSGCTAGDGVAQAGFAHKGEGFVLGPFPDAGGLGSATTGGGGGDCYNAGGGGGGNGGQGGQGGLSGDGDRDVGGRGGAAVSAPSLLERLSFGGGGGAGETDNGTDRNGGSGGGVIVVRAQEIVLPGGRYQARGGGPARADQSGGAGGGGGGSILVQAVGTLACQQLSVRGGNGAALETFNANNGPGGGGAGGRALAQAGAIACSIENRAGSAGRDNTNTGPTKGATPDAGAELGAPFATLPQLIPTAYCGTCR